MTLATRTGPRKQSLTGWYNEHAVDDVVLYDLTAQTSTTLSAVFIERRRAESDPLEREHWSARLRLVKRQREVLDPHDRAGLIAQQEAWLDEIDTLTRAE